MLVLTCFFFNETNFIYFLNGSNHLANSEGKAAWITHTFEVPIIFQRLWVILHFCNILTFNILRVYTMVGHCSFSLGITLQDVI